MSDPNPIDVQRYLGGVDYPASKDEVLRTAEESGANDRVLDALGAIPDREYDGPTDVTSAVANP